MTPPLSKYTNNPTRPPKTLWAPAAKVSKDFHAVAHDRNVVSRCLGSSVRAHTNIHKHFHMHSYTSHTLFTYRRVPLRRKSRGRHRVLLQHHGRSDGFWKNSLWEIFWNIIILTVTITRVQLLNFMANVKLFKCHGSYFCSKVWIVSPRKSYRIYVYIYIYLQTVRTRL